MNAGKEFLGRGWSFPPAFEPALGVVMSEAEEDIHQSLHILLTTITDERIMQPKYGCDLSEMIFEPLDTAFQTYLKEKMETSILYYESRIKIDKIDILTDPIGEGYVEIRIGYFVKATNSRFNFVFPFYQKEGTELLDLLTTLPEITT